jgi:hypothetical protein
MILPVPSLRKAADMWNPTGTNATAFVDTAPRWRNVDHGWTRSTFQRLIDHNTSVRVAGWRYLDPSHQVDVGHAVASRREVHTTTKIEIPTRGNRRIYGVGQARARFLSLRSRGGRGLERYSGCCSWPERLRHL